MTSLKAKDDLKIRTGNMQRKSRESSRYNIAFKCNYCDGGKSEQQIGYDGACSDEVIHHNIVIKHRVWCEYDGSDDAGTDRSPCRAYFNGEISRQELDNICSSDGYVCHESQMLRDWRAFAGFVRHGKNAGQPIKIKTNVPPNSLCVLTTRDLDKSAKERERYIFAVFLVDESYGGDDDIDGYVSTTSEYKIKLSPEEAHELLYWNYYKNLNKPDSVKWGSGLYRYLDDIQAAQILQDIAQVKNGTADETLAKEFFAHFCQINNIQSDEIPKAQGALRLSNGKDKLCLEG